MARINFSFLPPDENDPFGILPKPRAIDVVSDLLQRYSGVDAFGRDMRFEPGRDSGGATPMDDPYAALEALKREVPKDPKATPFRDIGGAVGDALTAAGFIRAGHTPPRVGAYETKRIRAREQHEARVRAIEDANAKLEQDVALAKAGNALEEKRYQARYQQKRSDQLADQERTSTEDVLKNMEAYRNALEKEARDLGIIVGKGESNDSISRKISAENRKRYDDALEDARRQRGSSLPRSDLNTLTDTEAGFKSEFFGTPENPGFKDQIESGEVSAADYMENVNTRALVGKSSNPDRYAAMQAMLVSEAYPLIVNALREKHGQAGWQPDERLYLRATQGDVKALRLVEEKFSQFQLADVERQEKRQEEIDAQERISTGKGLTPEGMADANRAANAALFMGPQKPREPWFKAKVFAPNRRGEEPRVIWAFPDSKDDR